MSTRGTSDTLVTLIIHRGVFHLVSGPLIGGILVSAH